MRVLACVFVALSTIFGGSASQVWNRTSCGSFTDLITAWGSQVNPKNVLPEYPRPQLVRGDNSTWFNLNGLWEFEPADPTQDPPFGKTLETSILVPFPVESCLSGIGKNYQYIWYRLEFERPSSFVDKSKLILLHFGAVDWECKVYVNGKLVGFHSGGFDGFTFDITSYLNSDPGKNELIVYVHDPSENGYQPNGKQRISAINNPDGDTYTPSSGIWQTVWLEAVPKVYISNITILTDTRKALVSANIYPSNAMEIDVVFNVYDGSSLVAKAIAPAGSLATIYLPDSKLWSPESPFLYTLIVETPYDIVQSYFGMRSIELGKVAYPAQPDTGAQQGIDRPGGDLPGYPINLPSENPDDCHNLCKSTEGCNAWSFSYPKCGVNQSESLCWLKGSGYSYVSDACHVSGELATPASVVVRPFLNGGEIFLAGWLDQSYWPDGLYTAPTDDALVFDLNILKKFGLNTIRLHQKVNSERWYYYADILGILVLQDQVQKYGGATSDTVEPFISDLRKMIAGRYNHPSIIQWNVFNEYDCVSVFNVSSVVELVRQLDPSRLVNTNSGGPANNLYIGDVNDIHTYPYPGIPKPSITQYGMVGEFGGVGAFVEGHVWVPGKCQTYLAVNKTDDEFYTYTKMIATIQSNKKDISCCIYTQIADVERECDGFLNYDRTSKFTEEQIMQLKEIHQKLIYS